MKFEPQRKISEALQEVCKVGLPLIYCINLESIDKVIQKIENVMKLHKRNLI